MELVGLLAQQSASVKFINTLVSGVALGAIYALLAMGFVIIFKATQVLNFAHGALAALGGYLTAYMATILQIPVRWLPEGLWGRAALGWLGALALAVAATAFVGLVLERLFVEPMVGEPLFSIAIITLGIEIVVRTITEDYINVGTRSVGDPWQFTGFEFFLGDERVFILYTQFVTLAMALVASAFLVLFFRSRTGIAMRATAFDQEAAMAQGIPVSRIFAVSWIIGAGLAAIAGVFASVAPRAGGVTGGIVGTAFVAFRAFPAIIIGGLDSIAGSAIGALIVGLAEVFAGSYLSGPTFSFLGLGFQTIVPYLLMLAVLLVRPYGLFGTAEIRRV